MSLYDYEAARLIEVDGHPFYALIMAAMRQADTGNLALLRGCWPEVHGELVARYRTPGALLVGDPCPVCMVCRLVAADGGSLVCVSSICGGAVPAGASE